MDYDREEEIENECCVTSCVGSERMAKSKGFKWTMKILHAISGFILGPAVFAIAVVSITDDPPSFISCSGNITGSVGARQLKISIFLATWGAYFTYLSVNFAILWAITKHCCCCIPFYIALWFPITIGEIIGVVIHGINYLVEIFPAWLEDTGACSHLIVVLSVIMVIAIAAYGMMYATIAVIGVTCNIVHIYKKL